MKEFGKVSDLFLEELTYYEKLMPNFDVRIGKSAPELIGIGNVRANQNAVKFETANEKMIGIATSDQLQSAPISKFGLIS